MKKLILLLLFIPLFSFGQSLKTDFKKGYEAGYKKGYCMEDILCSEPVLKQTPISKSGFDSYSDGYAIGVIDGNRDKENEDSDKPKESKRIDPEKYSIYKSRDQSKMNVNIGEVVTQLNIGLNNALLAREMRRQHYDNLAVEMKNMINNNTYRVSNDDAIDGLIFNIRYNALEMIDKSNNYLKRAFLRPKIYSNFITKIANNFIKGNQVFIKLYKYKIDKINSISDPKLKEKFNKRFNDYIQQNPVHVWVEQEFDYFWLASGSWYKPSHYELRIGHPHIVYKGKYFTEISSFYDFILYCLEEDYDVRYRQYIAVLEELNNLRNSVKKSRTEFIENLKEKDLKKFLKSETKSLLDSNLFIIKHCDYDIKSKELKNDISKYQVLLTKPAEKNTNKYKNYFKKANLGSCSGFSNIQLVEQYELVLSHLNDYKNN